MVSEPCESYHVSHPIPCIDCKRKDEKFHALEARIAELEKVRDDWLRTWDNINSVRGHLFELKHFGGRD